MQWQKDGWVAANWHRDNRVIWRQHFDSLKKWWKGNNRVQMIQQDANLFTAFLGNNKLTSKCHLGDSETVDWQGKIRVYFNNHVTGWQLSDMVYQRHQADNWVKENQQGPWGDSVTTAWHSDTWVIVWQHSERVTTGWQVDNTVTRWRTSG
jgi:hypothetical protein